MTFFFFFMIFLTNGASHFPARPEQLRSRHLPVTAPHGAPPSPRPGTLPRPPPLRPRQPLRPHRLPGVAACPPLLPASDHPASTDSAPDSGGRQTAAYGSLPPARTPAFSAPPREGPAAPRARPQGRGDWGHRDAAADYRPQRAARGGGGHGGGRGGGLGARLRGGGAVHLRLPRGRSGPLLAAAAGAARPLAGGGGGGRGRVGGGRSGGAGLCGGDGGRAAGRVQVAAGPAGGVGCVGGREDGGGDPGLIRPRKGRNHRVSPGGDLRPQS